MCDKLVTFEGSMGGGMSLLGVMLAYEEAKRTGKIVCTCYGFPKEYTYLDKESFLDELSKQELG